MRRLQPNAISDKAGPPHLDEVYLILSTIHSAKGKEWKSVFVLNTVDGCIPVDIAVGTKDGVDEERRLLYVAMTHAKDCPHLIARNASIRTARRSGAAAMSTRFAPASFPTSILTAFEQTSWSSI